MEAIQTELQNLLKAYLAKNPGSEPQLSSEFLVSIPTIERWVNGKNLPHPAMAKPLVEYLKNHSEIQNEPTPDEISGAILEMINTLKFIDGEPENTFPENISRAIKKFDRPELRTSLSRRLYHPEKYVKDQDMIEVSVKVGEKTESGKISKNTYEILRDGALLRNRPIQFFLYHVVKEHGSLTEKNILNFLEEKWII